MADEMKRWGGLLALALLAFLAGPALGDEAAVGEGGGGYLPLGDGWEPSGTITIMAPTDIADFALVPGQNNVEEGTLTVTADAAWSVSVSDEDDETTGGKMTEYDTQTGNYIADSPDQLEAFMLVKATGTYGSGTNVSLEDGGQIASSSSAVTDEEIPITFTQPVSWSDDVSAANRGYKIVITFTGSVA